LKHNVVTTKRQSHQKPVDSFLASHRPRPRISRATALAATTMAGATNGSAVNSIEGSFDDR
jgi:hypothetical protein